MILGTPSNQDKHPDAIGRMVDGVEAQVIGADGRALPEGEVGLLGFRGEGFPTEYIGNPEATRRAFRKGCFYPGDLAAIDGDGYVFFKGRADDVINNAGTKFWKSRKYSCLTRLLLKQRSLAGHIARTAKCQWPAW